MQDRFESDVHYVLLQDTAPVEEKKSNANHVLSISDIIETILPFLNTAERGKLSSTARTFRNIDPMLEKIHLLEQWEAIIENDAKSLDLKRLITRPGTMCAIGTSFAVTGFALLLDCAVEWALNSPSCDDGQDASCAGKNFGPVIGVAASLGIICCAYPMFKNARKVRSAYQDPRAYYVSKDDRVITTASHESKNCLKEFNEKFLPLYQNQDPSQITLRTFKHRLFAEKCIVKQDINNPKKHVINIKS